MLPFIVRFFIAVLVFADPCQTCCIPLTWFGPVRVLRTMVAPEMPGADVQVMLQGYDAKYKRVAVGYTDDQGVYIRDVLDYGKGIELIIKGSRWNPSEEKCTKYILSGTWQEACIPGTVPNQRQFAENVSSQTTQVPTNATLSGNIYMGHPPQQYYKTLNAHVYNLEQGTLKGKVMVAQDTCGLVGEVVYDLSDPAGAKVINRLYVNQSLYDNEDFFKPPVNVTCIPDVNPPYITAWERLRLFGSLIAWP